MADREKALLAQDAAARVRALDIGRSFLVQAPAGSGKTGLLIQRYLALLAHVDRPERIVAMTFTRKAAGEMRERIVAALAAAADGSCALPAEPHERTTHELALAVLAQDRARDWQLASHPSRLAIDTIDAVAAGFARQAPVTARLGAVPAYIDDATELYVEAARAALARAPGDDPSWRTLLAHLDNHADAAVDLIAGLLAKREQWLDVVFGDSAQRLREALDATLVREIEGELDRAQAALRLHADDLAVQLDHAARHLDGHLAQSLSFAASAGGMPAASVDALVHWQALADWLLVKDRARIRKAVDKRSGFPPGAAGSAKRNAKDAMDALLRRLDADPVVALALDTLRSLPPGRCGDDAWAIVEALLGVLPRVAAELELTFAQNARIDFTQGAFAAMRALGDPQAPSDLLLRLDNSIAHLLIDEFQDTSVMQHTLIDRLTAGWTPGDGRTLFAVGDPMQSIYRFRGAEVRLFVEAQETGAVGDVPIECLTLRRNFRSQKRLVDWVNHAFPAVLGRRSDPWRSAVAFAEATAVRPALDDAGCTFDLLASEADEARAVVGRVKSAMEAGDAKIAVLVRTRRHAEPLLPALRAADIAFTAVELDTLGERQAVRDLTALTHALVQPADRLAWLSVLRAPWCALGLADLLAVAATDPSCEQGVLPALVSPSDVADLSDDGRARMQRTATAILPALASRGRASVAARVRGAWLALGGPACVDDSSDLDAAERFLALLASHEHAGDVADWPSFIGALSRLREGDAAEDVRVRVMTLHKAKGLEFDAVIVPALAREARASTNELLRWRRRPGGGLLIAPGKARGGEPDPICAYLARLAADEEESELGRLLYVGCTRAKRRLHLTATLATRADSDGDLQWVAPPSKSALARLWPIVEAVAPRPSAIADEASAPAPITLARVSARFVPLPPDGGLASPRARDEPADALPFDWVRETARHVGVVVHRLLAQLAREGLDAWHEPRIDALAPSLAVGLGAEGVDPSDVDAAVAQVQAATRAVIADPRGRWLFDPSHADARSEWALAGLLDGTIVHRTLDRTFVAGGVRWIVDFKTGAHEGSGIEAFLDLERARYAPALEQYARLVRAIDPRPIRVALYHPLVRGFRDWAFDG